MKREVAPPASTGIAQNRLKIREKLNKPLAIAVMIGALAVPAARAASNEESPVPIERVPEFIIGAQEDTIVNKDEKISQDVAQKLKDLDFNVVKITAPWSYPRQCAAINDDPARYINAFQAAKDNQLVPVLNLFPGGQGDLGQAPSTPSQQTCYRDTLIAYEHVFAEVNPGGHIIFEIPNEPNSETFWRPQNNSDGEWVAPKAVSRTLAKSYWAVKKEAQELGIGVTLIGGALASGHNAVGFTKAMGEARQELEVKGAIMDGFSIHPYGETNDEPPDVTHPDLTTVGFAELPSFINSLDDSFHKPMSVWLTEYGAKTKVPANKTGLYTIRPNISKDMISEATQAEFYTKAIQMARSRSRVDAIILFNVIDDPDGHWTSGLMYPDGSPKSSYSAVHQAIIDAKSRYN